MNLFFFKDCFSRVLERKRTLLALAIFFLAGWVLGMCFAKTPTFYGFQINICDRFLTRVCYSERSIFLIFLERTAGCAVLAAVVLVGGIHLVGLALPVALLLYRSYTFGGSLVVLFGVYGVSGAIVAVVLYLPVRILTDAALLSAATVSFGRAKHFRFAKQDLIELGLDFLAFLAVLALICLLEAILLLAIFHPLGNLF